MASQGRKPTAAMPKPKQFFYQCWQCPLPGKRTEPWQIDGGTTQAQADLAWSKHYAQYHAQGEGLKLTGNWIGRQAKVPKPRAWR